MPHSHPDLACSNTKSLAEETCPTNTTADPTMNTTGYTTTVQRNVNLEKCHREPFFSEVHGKLLAHKEKYPNANVINLGIGDTSEPIPEVITSAMERYARGLSTSEGYSGYGTFQGNEFLRIAIAETLYKGLGMEKTEIFVSDGAKGCFARLQVLFGSEVTVAVQDPCYPVIPLLCALMGQTGTFANDIQKYHRLQYMKCTPENNFFPDLTSVPRTDIIFFCSPSNPRGSAATREQLKELVAFARKNGSIIVYDAVYSIFMTDDNPKTIYEIPGAREVAIEIGSFSKLAAFTGVRLGWTIIPKELLFADAQPVIKDFYQVSLLTFTAGPSNIAQAGGLACLSPEGIQAIKKTAEFYLENARILVDTFVSLGLRTFGGRNSPFVWVEFPGCKSREIFDEILEKAHIVGIPGFAFGSSGEGFLRFSAFGHRDSILEAARRLRGLDLKFAIGS